MDRTLKSYFHVYIALMILLALTVAAATMSLRSSGIFVALAIATMKAALVLYFFMKLKEESATLRLVAWSSLLWLLILFSFTISDYLSRSQLGVPGK